MAQKVLMTALSPTMDKGTIVKWDKEEGDQIVSGDLLCEVETDKTTMDYESIEEGALLKILVSEGEQAGIGEPIAIIGEQGEDISELLEEIEAEGEAQEKVEQEGEALEELEEEAQPGAEPEISLNRIIASPLARKIAGQKGIDLRSIEGSGPRGRIVKRDIDKAMTVGQTSAKRAVSTPIAPTLADEVIPVSGKRRIIAQRLVESKYSAPHYYLRLKVRMDALMGARTALNKSIDSKVSVNAFMIKFVAEALKRHPIINSTWQGDTILRHGSIDIGLAVAQEDGLITPVVRDCANKGIIEIDTELRILIDKALSNKLTPEEYSDTTFTISNLGSFGIEEFTAVINPPGSAILALGKMGKEAVVGAGDSIEIHSLMAMTLSCDHRVIDGDVGAVFLKDLKDIMENPIRTLY
ncbi:MAG TPA: dihydrolipoamide acetyltransferase family protein [Clostridia bacterium]|nr:dihydrolipoamide acetyltransferase family protein [Clostridia bacterium]